MNENWYLKSRKEQKRKLFLATKVKIIYGTKVPLVLPAWTVLSQRC